MRFIMRYWPGLMLLAASAVAGAQCAPMTPAPEKAVADVAATAPKPSSLESVLSTMDDASEKFRSAQADLNSQQYQKVVDETDVQKGKVYFRRKNKELEMNMDIGQPESRDVIWSAGNDEA